MALFPPRLILASSSPRRRRLLERFNIPFQVIESGVNEDALADTSPRLLAMQLAQLKAKAVAHNVMQGGISQTTLILGADTVIDLDGSVLGKPQDTADARQMLDQLRGRSHLVITGICLILLPEQRASTSAVSTTVRMKDYDHRTAEEYLRSGEPMDKAGSYAIQGLGGQLVEGITGCFRNVVGLPLCEVARLAEELLGRPVTANPVCDLPSGASCPRIEGISRKAAKPQRRRKA